MKTAFIYADFAFRILVLALCLTVGVFFLITGARAALAVTLRPSVVITDEVLRVGDLFEGASADKASMILGPAPQPGKEMVLNANTLLRIASAMELAWRPSSTTDQIVIRRDATVIGSDIVESLISEKLFENGIPGKFKLNLGSLQDIVLPREMPAQAEIAKFSFNAQKDTFEAKLAAPSAANPVREFTVTGSIERMVSIPVLKDGLKNGDIIGMTDIDFIDIYQKDMQRDYVIKPESMIGMTPRRMVVAGKPIRDLELENPQIVDRGSAVTLLYKNGAMTLSARGKSLQNGARGDTVRVVNMASNKSLEGLVTAENEVTVIAASN